MRKGEIAFNPILIDTHFDQQQQTAFEKTVRKGEIARNKQFLLFPQCFLPNQIIVSPFVHISNIVSLLDAEFEKPKIGISGKGLTSNFSFSHNVFYHKWHLYFLLTLSQTSPGFYVSAVQVF